MVHVLLLRLCSKLCSVQIYSSILNISRTSSNLVTNQKLKVILLGFVLIRTCLWGYSVGSETRLCELMICVLVEFIVNMPQVLPETLIFFPENMKMIKSACGDDWLNEAKRKSLESLTMGRESVKKTSVSKAPKVSRRSPKWKKIGDWHKEQEKICGFHGLSGNYPVILTTLNYTLQASYFVGVGRKTSKQRNLSALLETRFG